MMRWLNLSGLGWALGLTLSVSVVNTGVAQRVCGLPAAAICGHRHAVCGAGLEAFRWTPTPTLDRPRGTHQMPPDATVIVNYNGFPEEAMLAFDYAVDIWSVLLTSDVTVRIDAFWTDLVLVRWRKQGLRTSTRILPMRPSATRTTPLLWPTHLPAKTSRNSPTSSAHSTAQPIGTSEPMATRPWAPTIL